MHRLNLVELLGHIDNYVLIKKPDDFPYYRPASDIDLVVPDRAEAIDIIYSYYENQLSREMEMTVHDTAVHCHVDFSAAGQLQLRIDLIDNLEFFSRIAIKPGYIFKLFKDRQSFACEGGSVYIPADEDDLTLRYFEYLEWFDVRPDKIKHLDFICAVEDERLKERFFENTHRYVQIKRKTWSESSRRQVLYECQTANDAVQMIKVGLRYLVQAVRRRAASVLHKLKSDRFSRIERIEHRP